MSIYFRVKYANDSDFSQKYIITVGYGWTV